MTTKPKNDEEKYLALKANGTFYTKANEVHDELFVDNIFFDRHDLLQVKYEMLRRVAKDGWSISKATKIFGFSRPTYYETHAGFEAEGLQGLLPKSRGPKGPHKLSHEVLTFIEELWTQEQEIHSSDIAQRVVQQFNISVHPRSIVRAIDKHNKKKRG